MSADGATLTVISGSEPIISRWNLEGIGLGRRLVAPGHLLAGPYSYEGSSVATAPQVDAPTPGVEIGRIMEGVLEGVVVVDTATGRVTYRFDEAVSDVGWAREGRLYARSEADGLFHIIEADTGEEVGTTIDPRADTLWPSIDGTRLHAAWADGLIQELDPRTGDLVGEPWQVEEDPLWISVAPEGDRIAVTYSTDGWRRGRPWTRRRSGWRCSPPKIIASSTTSPRRSKPTSCSRMASSSAWRALAWVGTRRIRSPGWGRSPAQRVASSSRR